MNMKLSGKAKDQLIFFNYPGCVMKKFNFTISIFIFSLLIYLYYVIGVVFIKKSGYEAGIFYFSPAYLYSFYKLIRSGIKRTWSAVLFIAIPFSISCYLSLIGQLPGWEISGFIPVVVIMSYLFKSGKNGETPLQTVYLPKIVGVFLFAVFFFSFIHYLNTGSLESALYLAVSIYSPAPVAVVVAVFINFIITTAALSVVLNDLRFFNDGAVIKKLIFETDSFLTFPHLNLSGIETIAGFSKKDFLVMVEKLNAAAEQSGDYSETVKKDGFFSHKFEDGTTLAMAPLKTILAKGIYKKDGIVLPDKNDERSFIALVMNDLIAGYYAIEKINPSTNASLLEMFEKKYGVKSVICAPVEPKIWKNCAKTFEKLDDAAIESGDIVISDKDIKTKGINLFWGGNDYERGDIFLAKPFVTTLMNLIVVSREVKARLIKGIIVCSFPFAISLFSISFGLKIPQISTISLMFSFAMTLAYVSYFKSVNKRS